MSKRITAVLLVGMALGLALPAAAGDELDAVVKKLSAAWKKHTSMTAKVTMTNRMEQGPMSIEGKGEGTYEAMRKGDQLLYRMDWTNTMVQKMGGQETKSEQKITTLSDGKYQHSLIDSMGRKMAVKAKADSQNSTDPESVLKKLREEHSLKLLPEQTVDGQKVFVIEATPKQVRPAGASKVVFDFLQDHGVLAKMVAYDQAGKPMQTTTFTDIKFDVKIDPKRFVFEVPPGVEVIDQTGE